MPRLDQLDETASPFVAAPVPQLNLAPPAPAPPPPSQIVDRQAFLQGLQRQLQMIERSRQMLAPITNLIGEAQRDELRRQLQTPVAEPMPGAGDAAYQARVRAQQANDTTSIIGLARTEIPYAKRVAETVGNVARTVGEPLAATNPMTSSLQALGSALPHVPTPSGIAAGVLESSIPTEVWMAALELVPGVGTVPDLVKLARRGGPEWVTAARALAQSDDGVRLLKMLNGDTGKLVLPGTKKVIAHTELANAPEVLSTTGIAYHGTGQRFKQFSGDLMDETALYGPGVYLTDDAKIAKSYAEQRAKQVGIDNAFKKLDVYDRAITTAERRAAQQALREGTTSAYGGEATIQTVAVKPNLRILNMERPLPADAARVYLKAIEGLGEGQPVADALAFGKAGKDVSRLFRNALADSEMYDYEAGQILGELNDALKAAGYDGITHTGGIQGGAKHTVTVIFDPANTEITTPMTRALSIFKGGETGAFKLPGLPGAERRAAEARIKQAPNLLQTGEPAAVVPDAVRTMLARRARGAAKPEEAQASWEVLPPTYQKFITAMSEAVLTPQERRAIVRAGRARQSAKVAEALTGEGSMVERAVAGRKAQGGKIIPQFRPIAQKFDAPQVDELFNGIDSALAAGTVTREEALNATSAMHLIMYGERLPGVASEARLPLNVMPYEIKLLGRVYGPAFEASLPHTPAELSLFQKAVDIANFPRALKAGFDISAPGRQGIFLAGRNPREWLGAFRPMFKSMRSEEGFNQVVDEIRRNPKFEDAVTHGLELTQPGGQIAGTETPAEEAFISGITSKIPFLKGSERGYVAYLDYLRMTVYEKGANRWERAAKKTGWTADRLDQAKGDWAHFVNVASGRGDMGALSKYSPALNTVLFSPRYLVSRPQTVWDLVRPGIDPAVRQAVGENLGAFFGSGMLLLGAARMAGADVELDPRSTNFGKIIVPLPGGKIQTIEFWGGFQQFARYAVQIATARRKEQFTGAAVGLNRGKTLGAFLRSKLSPLGALGWDTLVEGGTTYEGTKYNLEPKNMGKLALDQVTPLVISDMIDGFNASFGGGLSAGGASVIGGNVSTFGSTEKQQKTIAQTGVQKQLTAAGFPDLDTDFDQNPAVRALVAKTLSLTPDAVKGKSLTEIRKEQVAQYAPVIAKRDNVPLAEAERRVGGGFDKALSALRKQEHDAQIAFWKAHPALLKQALDAGLTTPSQEKADILAGK